MQLEEGRKILADKGHIIFKLEDAMTDILLGEPGAYMTQGLLIALLADGHILIESCPGMAKTLAIKTLGNLINAKRSRIQFVSDMLPTDIIGLRIYKEGDACFQVEKGPIFANLVLADEINRTPPKTQSALLEPMAERKCTIGEEDYLLPDGKPLSDFVVDGKMDKKAVREEMDKVFMVMATINPVEQAGTHILSETAIDRFMIKLIVRYPDKDSETLIALEDQEEKSEQLTPLVDLEVVQELRNAVQGGVYLDKDLLVRNYILDMVNATREPDAYGLDDFGLQSNVIELGGSPRASENIVKVSKAHAFLNGRTYVNPDDVQYAARVVLRHRIIMKRAAIVSNHSSEDVIDDIFNRTMIP